MIIGLYMGCIGVVKGLWKTKWKLLYDNRVICGLYRGNKGIMENKNGNYYMIIGLYVGCIGVIMGLWKIKWKLPYEIYIYVYHAKSTFRLYSWYCKDLYSFSTPS